jgi:hypothetical protein
MRCLPERIIGRRRSAGYDATLLGAAAAAKPQQPPPPADNVILRRRRSPTQHADGHAGVAGVAESVRRSWRDEFDAACAAAVHGAADGRADEKVEYQESSVLRELEGLYPVAFELDVRSDPAHAHMLQLYCGMDLLGTVPLFRHRCSTARLYVRAWMRASAVPRSHAWPRLPLRVSAVRVRVCWSQRRAPPCLLHAARPRLRTAACGRRSLAQVRACAHSALVAVGIAFGACRAVRRADAARVSVRKARRGAARHAYMRKRTARRHAHSPAD